MPFLTLSYLVFHAALSAFAVLLLRPDLLPLPLHQNLFVLERAAEVLRNLSPGNKMGNACSEYIQLLLSTLRNSELTPNNPYSPFIPVSLARLPAPLLSGLNASSICLGHDWMRMASSS
jgi:hypothetical protein